MMKSILVPLDGSAFGEHALPLALSLARRAGAALRVLRVVPSLSVVVPEGVGWLDPDLLGQLHRQVCAYLNEVLACLAAVSSMPVRGAVREGDVAACIQEEATRSGADLVVMSTQGRGAVARFWLGSVADEMVRRLPMPVLLVRPREGPASLTIEPDLSHILLPLDGSELAEQALAPATSLADLMTGAEVTLLRVVKPALRQEYLPEGAAAAEARVLLDQLKALQDQMIADADEYLTGVARRLRDRGLRVQTQVATAEQPAVAILKEATERGGGLIALETHGRRGLSRLILGSVADKVIRGSPVPVLVHRPVSS